MIGIEQLRSAFPHAPPGGQPGRCTMPVLPRSVAVSVAGAVLATSCCAFVPCHPGARIVGKVEAQGQPIAGATIVLFAHAQTSDATGCFYFDLASAYPLTLSASADGYRPVEAPAKFGFFHVTVDLSAAGSASPSEVHWRHLSSSKFPGRSPCTYHWSARVEDKVPSPSKSARGAQLNCWAP